ncbi:MAG: RpiB/LacA/LacB family sugar-phosphate isomerase [Bacteroidota bacterium]|nr:RpiB/LacA/LacB family sugar-phosphate isomerase [Ferruginibacter sp.]
MKIGIAADHGGFELKESLKKFVEQLGHEVKDFGAFALDNADDYPDYVVPLARAVAAQDVVRGIAVCGSGVGAAIAANKIAGVRAALINDHYSAHQGVEHDDLNILCIGGRVSGIMAAQDFVEGFLGANFTGEERHKRRLQKVSDLEK